VKTKREPRIDGELAYIPLTRGYEAVIDAADIALIGRHNWYTLAGDRTVYAARKETKGAAQAAYADGAAKHHGEFARAA
jgi:hypothetical protein